MKTNNSFKHEPLKRHAGVPAEQQSAFADKVTGCVREGGLLKPKVSPACRFNGSHFLTLLLCLFCAFAAPSAHAQSADAVLQQRLNHEIICPCPDCGKQAIDQCAPGCADGKKYRAEVTAQLEQGKDETGVLKYFQKTYGAAALASPPQEGFGLTSKWLPVGALLLGALPLWALTRHKRRPKAPRKQRRTNEAKDDSLDDALRDFDY